MCVLKVLNEGNIFTLESFSDQSASISEIVDVVDEVIFSSFSIMFGVQICSTIFFYRIPSYLNNFLVVCCWNLK